MPKINKSSWDALYELALPQSGYFRSAQAVGAGFSPQLLRKHVLAGRISHELRGVYRLVNYPRGEQDELVSLWLWSEEAGVFSHETALSQYQLSDVLPSRVHLTVPPTWRKRSAVPPILVLHHAEVSESDRTWVGAVPVTTIGRTLRDAVDAGVDPSLVAQAIAQGTARKILTRADVRGIVAPKRRGRGARKEDAQ